MNVVTEDRILQKTEITENDILAYEDYVAVRKERKQELLAHKKYRRVEIGPVACCYFESYQTMLHQIQEMLYIEKGGREQLADELAAYNPMVPKGSDLSCTVMFEIDDEVRRRHFLARLGGVEETMFFRFGEHEIVGVPESDVDRTTADGKASSVQFLHFNFNSEQIEAFKQAEQIVLGFTHPEYSHMIVLRPETQAALAEDFSV